MKIKMNLFMIFGLLTCSFVQASEKKEKEVKEKGQVVVLPQYVFDLTSSQANIEDLRKALRDNPEYVNAETEEGWRLLQPVINGANRTAVALLLEMGAQVTDADLKLAKTVLSEQSSKADQDNVLAIIELLENYINVPEKFQRAKEELIEPEQAPLLADLSGLLGEYFAGPKSEISKEELFKDITYAKHRFDDMQLLAKENKEYQKEVDHWHAQILQKKQQLHALLLNEMVMSIRDNNLPAVQALIKEYPELLSLKDEAGNMPLQIAQKWDRKVIAAWLENPYKRKFKEIVRKEIKTRKREKAKRLEDLFAAIRRNDSVLTMDYIRNWGNINEQNQKGKTALMAAAETNNPILVNLLLNNGADVNAIDNKGASALYYAVAWGNVDTVKELVDRVTPEHIYSKNKYNESIYERARENYIVRKNKIVKALQKDQKEEKEIKKVTNKKIKAEIEKTFKAKVQKYKDELFASERILDLLDPKGEKRKQDKEKDKLEDFFNAIVVNDPILTMDYIRSWGNINASNKWGDTPLLVAVRSNNLDLLLLLLNNKADVNAINGAGFSALHYAAYNGNADMVKELIGRMSPEKINARDNDGLTAFDVAQQKYDQLKNKIQKKSEESQKEGGTIAKSEIPIMQRYQNQALAYERIIHLLEPYVSEEKKKKGKNEKKMVEKQ